MSKFIPGVTEENKKTYHQVIINLYVRNLGCLNSFSLISFICKTGIMRSYSELTWGNNTQPCSKASGSSVVDKFRDKFCNCVSHKIYITFFASCAYFFSLPNVCCVVVRGECAELLQFCRLQCIFFIVRCLLRCALALCIAK